MQQESLPTERYVGERELAKTLGVSLATIRKWRSRGAGPRFARFGKAVRYPLLTALEWARAAEVAR